VNRRQLVIAEEIARGAKFGLKAGVNPKVVSERLGHSSVMITLDIYSHVLPGLQEDAALRFSKLLDGAKELD
jgi:integrase